MKLITSYLFAIVLFALCVVATIGASKGLTDSPEKKQAWRFYSDCLDEHSGWNPELCDGAYQAYKSTK